jgi:hypothetical protein
VSRRNKPGRTEDPGPKKAEEKLKVFGVKRKGVERVAIEAEVPISVLEPYVTKVNHGGNLQEALDIIWGRIVRQFR